jgi:signal transduction histidine kinase
MRRRLTLTVLAVTAMVSVAFLIPLGLAVKVVAADRALSLGDQESRSLASVLASETSVFALQRVVAQFNDGGDGRKAAVILPNGQRLGGKIEVPASELELARRGRAFSAASGGETRIWVPVRLSTGVVVGVVTVPNRLTQQGVWRAWLVLAGVGIAVIMLAMVLADQLGRSVVRSIADLDHATQRLKAGDLDARVEPAGPPEIENMGRAVNSLAERIIELLKLEREEAADLSHRLRTPLAQLQLEADTLEHDPDRQRMGTAVRDLTQSVNSVIFELRKGRTPRQAEESDLTASVRERVAFWSVLAEEQDRQWTLTVPPIPVPVPISGGDLDAAVDALLENVLAHTPEGTSFRVAVEVSASGVALTVEDDGPGLPQGPVTERGRSGAGSTGLGLDIVRRTAEAAQGNLSIEQAESGGMRAVVRFGPIKLSG